MKIQIPPQKGAQQPPTFRPMSIVAKTQKAGWIKMPLGMDVGLGPGHIVLDGYLAAPPKMGQSPQFSAHVCCGQRGCQAGWIKMPLGTEVGLGRGDIVYN